MTAQEDISELVVEYRALASDTNNNSAENLSEAMIRCGEWSPKAAAILISLSKNYGSFILRNALALSIALKIEDGDLGL